MRTGGILDNAKMFRFFSIKYTINFSPTQVNTEIRSGPHWIILPISTDSFFLSTSQLDFEDDIFDSALIISFCKISNYCLNERACRFFL